MISPVFAEDLYQVSLLPGRGEAKVSFLREGSDRAMEKLYRSGDDDRTLRVEPGHSYLFPSSGWDRFAGSRRGPFRIEVRTRTAETVLASGKLVGVTVHGDGFSTTVWSGDDEDRGIGLFLLTSRSEEQARPFAPPPWGQEFLAEILTSLVGLFGPQPGGQPDIVTVDLPLPMAKAFPGVLLLDRRLAEGQGVPPAGRVATLAHEAAHLWWANHVRMHGPGAAALQEGLAEFGAARALGAVLGKAAEEAHWRTLRDEYLLSSEAMVESGVSLTSGDDRPFRRALRYAKAAWVIRMLEARVGPAALHAALRAFTKKRSPLSWEELLQASGKLGSVDLTGFRAGWVSGTGHPNLEVRTDDTTGQIRIVNQGRGSGDLPVSIRCQEAALSETLFLAVPAGRSVELPGIRGPACQVMVDRLSRFLHGPPGPLPATGLTLGRAWGHPVVRSVAPLSLADRSGLRPGDLVLQVNRQPLSERDVKELMGLLAGRKPIRLRIRRGKAEMEITYLREGP